MDARLEAPALCSSDVDIVVPTPRIGSDRLPRRFLRHRISEADDQEIALPGGAFSRRSDYVVGNDMTHAVPFRCCFRIYAAALSSSGSLSQSIASFKSGRAGYAVFICDAEDPVGSVQVGVVVAAVGALVDRVSVARRQLLNLDVVLGRKHRRFGR